MHQAIGGSGTGTQGQAEGEKRRLSSYLAPAGGHVVGGATASEPCLSFSKSYLCWGVCLA